MARRKTQKSLIKPLEGKNMKGNQGRDGIVKNVALGATGLAITAGVVAVGAAMVNKNMRNKMSKVVEDGVRMLRENAAKAPEQAQKYMATAHEIPSMGRTRRTKAKRGRRIQKQEAVKV